MKTVVHIGQPKAASSTLQYNLFCNLASVLYVARPGYRAPPEYERLGVLISNAVTSGARPRLSRAALQWRRTLAASNKLVALFSDERVATASIGTGRTLLTERATLVRDIFGRDATILVVVRNPQTFIPSLRQQVAIFRNLKLQAGPQPFEEWLLGPHWNGPADAPPRATDLAGLKYRRGLVQALFIGEVVARYVECFGRDKVAIIPFELIQRDPDAFHREVCDVLEVEVPAGLADEPGRNITTERPEYHDLIAKFPEAADLRLPERHAETIEQIAREQAAILDSMAGRSISDYWFPGG